jgi:hypothetical protein
MLFVLNLKKTKRQANVKKKKKKKKRKSTCDMRISCNSQNINMIPKTINYCLKNLWFGKWPKIGFGSLLNKVIGTMEILSYPITHYIYIYVYMKYA